MTVWTEDRGLRNRRWTYFNFWSLERPLDQACPGLGGKESMFSLFPAHMCAGFFGSDAAWVAGKLDRRVKASVLSFGENLFYIHFCSPLPSSNFRKDWVLPKYFRQTGRAAIQAAKTVNRLPNCSGDLLFSTPLPWGALEAGCACRPGGLVLSSLMEIDFQAWKSKEHKGRYISAIWVCTPRCIFAPKVEIRYFRLFSTKLNLDKTACKQIYFSKSLSFIISKLDCNLLVSRIRLKQSVGNYSY